MTETNLISKLKRKKDKINCFHCKLVANCQIAIFRIKLENL
jgi:hypothetical protein